MNDNPALDMAYYRAKKKAELSQRIRDSVKEDFISSLVSSGASITNFEDLASQQLRADERAIEDGIWSVEKDGSVKKVQGIR